MPRLLCCSDNHFFGAKAPLLLTEAISIMIGCGSYVFATDKQYERFSYVLLYKLHGKKQKPQNEHPNFPPYLPQLELARRALVQR